MATSVADSKDAGFSDLAAPAHEANSDDGGKAVAQVVAADSFESDTPKFTDEKIEFGDRITLDDTPPPPPHWKTNLFLFFFAFFLGYLTQFVHISATTVIAKEQAGNNLATLPGGLLFLGSMVTSFPLSILGEKIGLKYSYVVGTGLGLTGGALCFLSVKFNSFALLCLGMLFQGSQNATTQLVRYGVRAVVPKEYMARALSWTVAGATLAAPIGPIIAQQAIWIIPSIKYGGIYVIVEGLILLMTTVLMLVRFPPNSMPKPDAAAAAVTATPRGAIIKHYLTSKKFLIALIAGTIAQTIMVLVMAPVPLAIIGAGYGFADQANVLLAHILGMFFPSIFIGFFIDKFGTIKVNLTGMVLLTVAVGILMAGETMPIYYVGETLQGIGWNLSYISATAIILKMAAPGRELQTIQGLNDMISQTVGGIFGVISGPLYNAMHWRPLMALSLGLLGLAAVSILAVARIPWRGLRDSEMGLEGYKRQKDEELRSISQGEEGHEHSK